MNLTRITQASALSAITALLLTLSLTPTMAHADDVDAPGKAIVANWRFGVMPFFSLPSWLLGR